jgi:protocatechuate 3,4-dioxygenase beta subunit
VKRAAILLALLAGCGGSAAEPAAEKEETCVPTPGVFEAVAPAPEGAPSSVRLGPGMELKATKRNLAAARIGKPLVVSGTVRGEDCAPLAGATLYVHQTNGTGRYGPRGKGRDRCCWLQATVRTGKDGRYELDTVMPEGYGGGPAHIHMSAGHPDTEGLVTEVIFGSAAGAVDVIVMPLSDVEDGLAELDIVLERS